MKTHQKEISYLKVILGSILIFFSIVGFLTIIAGTHPSPLAGGIGYSIFLICGLLLVVYRFKKLSEKREPEKGNMSRARLDQSIQHSSIDGAKRVSTNTIDEYFSSTDIFSPTENRKLNKWGKIRKKGKTRFVLLNGVLLWGGLTGIIMSFIMSPIAMILFPVGGIFFGIITWNKAESHYLKAKQTHQNKSNQSNNISPTNYLIQELKSVNPLTRKVAAEKLGQRFDNIAISPLFEALMNWDEEEETVKVISVALFINLWILTPKESKEILIDYMNQDLLGDGQSGMFYSGVRGAIEGLLIKLVLNGERPNPGQSERISTMIRNALVAQKVKDIITQSPLSTIKKSDKGPSVSISEARAKAEELGMLSSLAVAAALNLEHSPKGTIYTNGVITCVCSKSLPLEVDITPGWSGGGRSVSCPDCGARISVMAGISDSTAVVVAAIEAVRRQYLSSKISLILTGYTEKQKEDVRRPPDSTETNSEVICNWCPTTDLHNHDLLLKAFMKTQYNSSKPDWTGLEHLSSSLPEGWMRHVIWLNAGAQCKSDKRWMEAARCYTLSLWEYYQYTDWSDIRSASWSVEDLVKKPESWEIISRLLSQEKASDMGEKLRSLRSKICTGEEIRATVSMLRETFAEWPN